MDETEQGGRTREAALGRLALGVVIAAGIVVPGVMDYALSALGHPQLGTLVWIVGYGTMVLLVWYVWIRPLELTGPSG